MIKKIAALSVGLAFVAAGMSPVLGASQNANTNVDIQNNIALAIANATPYGTGANTYQLTPTSGVNTTLARAGANLALPTAGTTTTSTLTMTTNSLNGGTITAVGDDNGGGNENAGELYSAANDEGITNTGAGADLSATCLASENDTDFEGLAIRAAAAGTDADYRFSSGVTRDTKYGLDTDATTRLYCHLDGTARNFVLTENFDDPANGGRDVTVDYALASKAGTVTAGTDYTEQVTFTAAAA